MRSGWALAIGILLVSCLSKDGGSGPCPVPAGAVAVRTISEYAGSPIPGVQVRVNDLPWVVTGASGCAVFADVAPPFTLRAYQTMAGTSRPLPDRVSTPTHWDDVWELNDVTENPAVLQVDGTPGPPPTWHETIISGSVTGAAGGSGSRVVVAALAPVDGGASTLAETDGTFTLDWVAWEGSSPQVLTVHALESDFPATHYSGYGSTRVQVSDGVRMDGVQVALAPVAEAHVSGSLTVPAAFAAGCPAAYAGLVFPDASLLSLPAGPWFWPSPGPCSTGAFDVPVPLIGAGSAFVGFSVVMPPTGTIPSYDEPLRPKRGPSAYATVKVDLSTGASVSGLALDLPVPASILEPADDATVAPDALFRWTASPGAVRYVLSGWCAQREGTSVRYVNYRGVDTTATEARLPSLPFISLLPGARCLVSAGWRDTTAPSVLGPVAERRHAGRYAWSTDVLLTIQ